MTQRLNWLDIVKGITIILMVIGHTSIPVYISNSIWSFHMPLFFFASGMCTNFEGQNFRQFVLQKTISIGRPFLIYSILVATILYICDIQIKASIVFGWGGYALWFVPVLLVSHILARLYFLMSSKYIRMIYLLLLPMSSYLLSCYSIHLPWNMSVAPYATTLLLFAYWQRENLKQISRWRWYWIIITFVFFLVISTYYRLDMCNNNVRPMLLLSVGAMAGSAFVTMVSIYIDKFNGIVATILKAIGKETFIVLAFSQVIIMVINQHAPMNSVLKYMLLILVLTFIKYIKDYIVLLYNRIFQ